MCYLCDGLKLDYEAYLASVYEAQSQIADATSFLHHADTIDRLRFQKSPEWSEPPLAASVKKLIFCNPDPDEGLLLFFLSAWLDIQAPYIRVWNQMVSQAHHWIHTGQFNEEGVPRSSPRWSCSI